MITDPQRAAEQALRMAKEGRVIAMDGTGVDLEVQTLCVHGDNPAALHHVRTIRQALEAEGLHIAPLGAGLTSSLSRYFLAMTVLYEQARIRLSGDRALLAEYGDGIDPASTKRCGR